MCVIVSKLGCDVINFEIKLIFQANQVVFFYMTKNQYINLNVLRTKRAFKIIKGLSLKQIKQAFLEGDSLTLKA